MEATRRKTLKLIATGGVLASAGCDSPSRGTQSVASTPGSSTPAGGSRDPIRSSSPLPPSGPWPTVDPFLFCVHHDDKYPAANASMGPATSLDGRELGQDFSGKDGWSMYHGRAVPGFPRHPHRGFETITVVRSGLIDHADSLGAVARYGDGDVQWLTAGDGINHAEMFPLFNREQANPIDFFQIWLNLPAKSKRAKPYFSMFWRKEIPVFEARDPSGRLTRVTVVAGDLGAHHAPKPPPDSWAAHDESGIAVWTIDMAPGAHWTLPKTDASHRRSLYIVRGAGLRIGSQTINTRHCLDLHPDREVPLKNGSMDTQLLLLQGRPIGEPVARHGPFVMNTPTEIRQAYRDYQRTQFGGWPWPDNAPTHGAERRRFARHANGHLDEPKG